MQAQTAVFVKRLFTLNGFVVGHAANDAEAETEEKRLAALYGREPKKILYNVVSNPSGIAASFPADFGVE